MVGTHGKKENRYTETTDQHGPIYSIKVVKSRDQKENQRPSVEGRPKGAWVHVVLGDCMVAKKQ